MENKSTEARPSQPVSMRLLVSTIRSVEKIAAIQNITKADAVAYSVRVVEDLLESMLRGEKIVTVDKDGNFQELLLFTISKVFPARNSTG